MNIISLLNPLPETTCTICNKILSNKSNRKRHVLQVHGLQKNCLFCKKKLKTNKITNLLRTHLIKCDSFINNCKKLESLEKIKILNTFYFKCFEEYKNNNKLV
jgi:flavoprotein